jgi:hypothetical protein
MTPTLIPRSYPLQSLSAIEPRFVCTACSKRGADVRPDFNLKPDVGLMEYCYARWRIFWMVSLQ